MDSRIYKPQFKNSYEIMTKGGVAFDIKDSKTYWLVFMNNQPPKLVDAPTLAIAHRFYPKAHTIYEVTGITLINPSVAKPDLTHLIN